MRVISAIVLLLVPGTLSRRCRCQFGDDCWPTPQQLSTFASELSQPLLHPIQPASPCYPEVDPSGNCSDVLSHFTDGIWRANRPGSMMEPNFETYIFENGTISACYSNVTLGYPCTQGSVPPLGVDARTVEDIQATVKFASKYNLRLVIKNTGCVHLILAKIRFLNLLLDMISWVEVQLVVP